jgi:hypothetical protein
MNARIVRNEIQMVLKSGNQKPKLISELHGSDITCLIYFLEFTEIMKEK